MQRISVRSLCASGACPPGTGIDDLEVYERNTATPETYKASKTITFLSEYTDVRYRDYSAIIDAGLAQCTPQCNVQPPLNTSDADIYIRDATGNVLAVYHYDRKTAQLRWSEQHLYGSARLGMYLPEKLLTSVSTESKQREVGYLGKQVFELSNHLGNVLATITDKKLQVSFNTTSTAYFEADVQAVQDYYAFGMQMSGRLLSNGNDYRYRWNTQEKVDEISGAGNHNTALYWEYNTRLGRRWNLDPKPQISSSDYAVNGNSPIWITDPLGDDWFKYQAKGEKKASWHWQKGQEAKYIGTDDKEHTTKKGFEYLTTFRKTATNIEGGTNGVLTLYKQDKIEIQTNEAFSGNSNYSSTAPVNSGDYYMRMDVRTTSNPVIAVNTGEGPQPVITWGLESIPRGGKMIWTDGKTYSSNSSITNAYGFTRIRLIPAKDLGNMAKDRGLYLHGKQDTHNWTHGCLCDKKEKIQTYFLNGAGKTFRGKVPLSVE